MERGARLGALVGRLRCVFHFFVWFVASPFGLVFFGRHLICRCNVMLRSLNPASGGLRGCVVRRADRWMVEDCASNGCLLSDSVHFGDCVIAAAAAAV